MPRACVHFKPSVAYRRDVFERGLRSLGYEIIPRPDTNPLADDLLVLWNRSPYEESYARPYERNKAKLIIAENGYIGKDAQGHKLFALARNHHNGAGTWTIGIGDRWQGSLKKWREQGTFVLILPQRAIGERGIAMPGDWIKRVTERLKRLTKRELRVRPHPGVAKTEPYESLEGCHAAITWGSGAGIKALFAGVPVFHELPQWIGASAAGMLNDQTDIEKPFMGDRLPMFQRLAWAQWSVAEIESGEAFACLLR